ncbi:MAG: tetratricopeptide repeat protein [Alistipes sp.]
MRRLTAITALCFLFCSAFVTGKGQVVVPEHPDSLRSVYHYTEGIKACTIWGDSLRAKELFEQAIRNDSTFAPAYYELAANGLYASPEQAVELTRRAYQIDTTNKWYHQFYGQALIFAKQYPQALAVFRQLNVENPKDPENYRIRAALYEQLQDPYMALATLDSAEIRFGRIPPLSAMKRQLLIATRQIDKATDEALAMVAAAPYEAEHHVVLADLYSYARKDSLALSEYALAMQIDSTNISTLMSLADFHTGRHNYRALLAVTKQLFLLDELPLETKITRFELLTSDLRFYRDNYLQLNDLASTLAIHYPNDKRVVELFAHHLIASGEMEQALTLYKLHLRDTPPNAAFFSAVIDIESYLQRPDSATVYITRALQLFPQQVEFHLAKGNAFNYAKQHTQAVKAYKQSLPYAATDSLRAAIWGLIGDTWHLKAEAGEPDWEERLVLQTGTAGSKASYRKWMKQCYAAYDRSLRYDKDNPLVLNNYAYFLSLEERELEKALTMSGLALALTDNNSTYLDTQGWILFKLGRFAEAKKITQQALALDRQNSATLMVHYGDILHALGEQFMAETYWRKALEKGYNAEAIAHRLDAAKSPKKETNP